ncbi:hypothetical protein [Bradyrhizobium sp. RDI18]|uniref:hypothetical protein n=1 Tax=Bradyrhizobium sp. RDI18 TaxID=3367400 RepID=UPI0037231718
MNVDLADAHRISRLASQQVRHIEVNGLLAAAEGNPPRGIRYFSLKVPQAWTRIDDEAADLLPTVSTIAKP